MAEVLAVVASGIAVGQATKSLGQAAVSLSRLWREVRNVSNTMQDILDDLDVAGRVVSAIEAEMGTPDSISTPLNNMQCMTIERFLQVHKKLEDLVDDLRADIASSRKLKRLFAGVKVVLKKDTLDAYERRVQRALHVLDSAVHLHTA